MFRMHRTATVRPALGSAPHLSRYVALALMAVLGTAPAAQQTRPYEPQLNQPGKDVQWVPTPPALAERMLDLARLTPDDKLVDLGSGDGVLVMAAARRGIRARGIEYDRRLVEYAKRSAREAGLDKRTSFVRGDIFETDFSDATVVTTFLLPSMNLRLRPRFLAMKPGTRIVAKTFAIGDWQPDQTVTVEPCERWCKAMLWVVPARVGGHWRTPKGDLVLTQRFQFISGTLANELIEHGRLDGDEISFTVGMTVYRGRVDGPRMRVSADDGPAATWTAQVAPRP